MHLHAPTAEWFHVTQRGVGRRPVFSTATDIRGLLGLLAGQAGGDALEVHAFAVLTNHCHLPVRARPKLLSAAMQRIFATYSRQLNRRLRRAGPLFGDRAHMRRIRSGAHWRATISYIDRNPVDAGLASQASHYPFGSAWHYARPAGPAWLSRDVIEAFVRRDAGADAYRPADYARVLGDTALPDGSRFVVERRLHQADRGEDPLDDLLAAAPADVRRWLERMARQADGAAAGPSLVAPTTLLAQVREARRGGKPWLLESGTLRPPTPALARRKRRGGLRRDGWSVIACGLLRAACGLTLDEIGQLVGLSVGGVHFQIRCHLRLLVADASYKARAERLLAAALRADFPDGGAGAAPGASWTR